MPFGGLPVEAPEPDPLHRCACGRPQQSAQTLQDSRIGGQSLGNGIDAAQAEACAQHLHLVIGRLSEEVLRVLYGGDARIVALRAVVGGKPEQLAVLDAAAHAKAPPVFVIGRGVRKRRKHGELRQSVREKSPSPIA